MNVGTRSVIRSACLLVALVIAGCAGPIDSRPSDPALRFAFGGDLAGQNVCRDREQGFPIFEKVLAREPDFFVALGDMIYADDVCAPVGRYGNSQIPRAQGFAEDRAGFRAHWSYVREDPSYAELLRTVPYYAVWDDHEVRNDFGPGAEQGQAGTAELLIRDSRAVFADLHPVGQDTLYFKKRFGRHLELFFLDTRSYRDGKAEPDTGPEPKTMLGATQRAWLKEALTDSDATWKIIVSSVPLAIPTGWPPDAGRDGWADGGGDTGFERELRSILRYFAEQDLRNLIVISADVHFASGFKFQPFPELPDFFLHEFVTGPLQAGLFPSTELDRSLNPERLYYHGPESVETVSEFANAVGWFNFGLIDIDAAGHLRFELVDGHGTTRASLSLVPL